MPNLTYVRRKKITLVRLRHIVTYRIFHLRSDSGFVKLDTTPGGGSRKGIELDAATMTSGTKNVANHQIDYERIGYPSKIFEPMATTS